VDSPMHFSQNPRENRQHMILRMKAGENEGWGEAVLTVNNPSVNFESSEFKIVADYLKKFKGVSAQEGLNHLKTHDCEMALGISEMLNMALLDIVGKERGVAAVRLMGFNEISKVAGSFSICEDEPDKIGEKIVLAKRQNLTAHMKMRIFGDIALDEKLVATLRKAVKPDTFIVVDATRTYTIKDADLQPLEEIIKRLAQAGANAIEDLASVPEERLPEIRNLGKKYGVIIISDRYIRDSQKALKKNLKGSADLFNLHPGDMGNFYCVSALVTKIKSFGGEICIGENSLIGPGCTVYQQIAIAVGAQWVETTEKPHENSVFLNAIVEESTYRLPDGAYAMLPMPGWGLTVDRAQLLKACTRHISL